MSVEDEELDFLSDEADEDEDETERNDDHVVHYAELLLLYRNMMRFDHIHLNGVVLDLLNEDENDNDSGFFHNWVEDMMSAFSSVMSPEDWSTSDSDDVGQRYAPFYEDTFSSCSYSSDSGADRWPPWTPNGSAEATNFTPDGTEAEAEAEAEATEQ